MNVILVKITEQGLRSGAHTHPLLKGLQPSVGHPGHLRRKAFHMILLLLEQGFGNEHGKVHVLHPGLLETGIQLLLDQLPDPIPRRLDHHTPLYGSIVDQLCLLHHIRVPLGKIHVHGCDLFHHLFVCHFSSCLSGNRQGIPPQRFLHNSSLCRLRGSFRDYVTAACGFTSRSHMLHRWKYAFYGTMPKEP